MSIVACLALAFWALTAPAAAQRLALTAVPEHYRLHFVPSLEDERFAGETSVGVRVLAPTSRFVLHAAELSIVAARVTANGVSQEADTSLDSSAQTLTLSVPVAVPAGKAELRIEYTGVLNRDLRGFYISEANNRKYAVTQLEATDARRMFPSFDEPSFKATFDISVTIDEADEAISNGPVTAVTEGPGPQRKTVRFAATARMPTYLVALAIGDFECLGTRVGTTPVRVCATPGKQHLMTFAMDATGAMLEWLNEYFVIDYPFTKLDLVAIPDFAAGAMENTGAIFFREALLLVGEQASLTARKRAAAVIAHEIAHHWFGNLVTMTWWDDLWLNEGFATWMETRAVGAWKPEWHVEVDELQATHAAMSIDALDATRAIRTMALTPAEINELFDPIAYEKAAAVLGMVESYVGEASFRAGINAYLLEYQYDNATAEDFWHMAARATAEPVDAVVESFVTRPGVPLVTVDAACVDGRTHVMLAQERFTKSPDASAPARARPWTIPVCLETRGDGPADACVLMRDRHATIELPGCDRWIMGNAGAEGYYRTRHTQPVLNRLAWANAALEPDERLSLLADEWALVRARRGDVSGFLDLAASQSIEIAAPGVIDATAARMQFLHEYVARPGSRRDFESWVRVQYGPRLQNTMQGELDNDDEQRRAAALLALVAGVGRDEALIASALQRVRAYLADPEAASIEPGMLTTLVRLAALAGGDALWQQYAERASTATAPEERYRFLYALASFRERALLRRTTEYAMSPAVRAQDRAGLLAAVLGNPAGRDLAWDFIRANWTALQHGLGAFGGTARIIEGLSAFCDEARVQEVRRFFETHAAGGAERTLEQTVEDIGQCATLVESQGPILDRWLAVHRSGRSSR